MSIKHFTGPQQEALLDLALLAMYADGHLASAEDERVHRLLSAMGLEDEDGQARIYDSAVARVRGVVGSATTARSHAAHLSARFSEPAQRHEVLSVLEDLLASDNLVVPQERGYLAAVREAFGT